MIPDKLITDFFAIVKLLNLYKLNGFKKSPLIHIIIDMDDDLKYISHLLRHIGKKGSLEEDSDSRL